jgi:DNA polymerase-3 subunit epsilon
LKHLRLIKPLVVFDLETTGTDPASDKIVEICALRVIPDGGTETRTRRLDPERPIPPQATAVHGIRDEDVRGAPTFRKIARSLLEFYDGADLAGFNVLRFDAPLLQREFKECGLEFGLEQRWIVDVMTIFHRKEPRDLSAAVRYYLGRDHEGAHAAEADVVATADVLEAQLERYRDLPRTVEELDLWARGGRPGGIDRSGKFVWRRGEAVFAFGKHQGRSLRRVASETPDYLDWIMKSDFPSDTKALVEAALGGNFPESSPADDDQST